MDRRNPYEVPDLNGNALCLACGELGNRLDEFPLDDPGLLTPLMDWEPHVTTEDGTDQET